MQFSTIAALLAVGGCTAVVHAAAVPTASLAPALPIDAFKHTLVKPLSITEILTGDFNDTSDATPAPELKMNVMAAAATCTNPRVRTEWDSYSTADRNNFMSAVQCLLKAKPSGKYKQAKNRYEDLVALHQSYTDNVHNNAKFLVWHRYFLWTFEDVLRSECGFTANLPWFDETKYAGRFSASSIFSDTWFGRIAINGGCVTTGKFAGLTLNVGPYTGNTPHCLSRNGDGAKTANCNAQAVNGCNAWTDYAQMAACSEGGAHAWGHNGIGSVMQDTWASPGDPIFWLHHAFIDRNFRIWQNANSARVSSINGKDHFGAALTLDTTLNVNNVRPTVRIRDVLNTMGGTLCYKYNY